MEKSASETPRPGEVVIASRAQEERYRADVEKVVKRIKSQGKKETRKPVVGSSLYAAQIADREQKQLRDAMPMGRLVVESLTPGAVGLTVAGLAAAVASPTIGHALTGPVALLMAVLMLMGVAAFFSGLLLWVKVHRQAHYTANRAIWEGGIGAAWATGNFRVPEYHAARSLRTATDALSGLGCDVAVEDTVRAAVEQGERLIDRLIDQKSSSGIAGKDAGGELILLSAQVEVLIERERQRVRREEVGGHLDVAARIETLAIASGEMADERPSEATEAPEVTT